ncbi:hypothetical protein M9Y10_001652 [Tritrichomonas musculus]|uniref:Uncharacterized protein n=1 Tax=Tritrichomonas musculus TaxID=1915356 RepID=A0ABR2L7L6_9EUKA
MKSGNAVFNKVGQGLLDLTIEPGTLGLKYYNHLKSSNIIILTNVINQVSAFSSSFSNSHGDFEIELEKNQRKISFSPSSSDSPIFTLQNYKQNPNKAWAFSGSFPFSIKGFGIVMNGGKTKKSGSAFATARFPYDFQKVKIDSRLLICPDPKSMILYHSIVNITHPLFEICALNKTNRSELHCQLNGYNIMQLMNIFFDLSFQKFLLTAYQLGGSVGNNIIKMSYLYNSFELSHKGRLMFDYSDIQFGMHYESNKTDGFDFKIGFSCNLSEHNFAFTMNKELKFVIQTNFPIPDIGNLSVTAGIDSFDLHATTLSASLLIVE